MTAHTPDLSAPDRDRSLRHMKRWQERSKRVAIARRLLPILIGVIVLGMAGWITVRSLLPGSLAEAVISEVMPNPRFYGKDNSDRAFLISAVQALRKSATDRTVVLSDPLITLGGARVEAKSATYKEDTGALTLQGDVAFDDGAGAKMSADQAVFDSKKGEVRGSAAGGGQIQAEGPFGTVKADEFVVADQGKSIIFNKVQGRIKK